MLVVEVLVDTVVLPLLAGPEVVELDQQILELELALEPLIVVVVEEEVLVDQVMVDQILVVLVLLSSAIK